MSAGVSILVVDPAGATAGCLEALLEGSVEAAASAHDAADRAAAVEAVVIGPAAERPVAAAQALHARDRDLAVLLLAPGEHAQRRLEEVRFAPFLGPEIAVVDADAADLAAEVVAAAEGTRRRREHRRAIAAVQRRLAPAPTPGALPSADVAEVLERAPIGAVLVDEAGRTVRRNRYATDLLGREAVLGSAFAEGFDGHDRTRLERILALGARRPSSRPRRLAQRRPDGRLQILELSAAPVPMRPRGRGVLAVLADVTAAVEAERARERTQVFLSVQYEIVRALADAVDLSEATRRIAVAVCRSLGWAVGAFWRVDRHARLARFVDAAAAGDEPLAEAFRAFASDHVFRRGDGLVGRTWERGEPEWVADVARDDTLQPARRAFFAQRGLGSCFALPVGVRGEIVGVFEFAAAAPRPADPDLVAALASATGQIGQFVQRIDAQHELRRSQAHRQRLVGAMLAAQEDERTRIATELHDDSIQVLTAVLLDVDRLRRRTGDPLLERVRDALRGVNERTRRLTFELRPQVLTERGVAAAVGELAAETAREAGLNAEVHITPTRYPWAVEELVYRTIAEAVANVRKHAGARTLRIRVDEREGALVGEVRDDGAGFDVGRVLGERRPLHLGVEAMAERVRLAGGELVIDSAPGRGTAVLFTVPAGAPGDADDDAPATTHHAQAEEWLALLDTLLETAPVGLAFWDTSFRFVRINDTLAEINGAPAAAHLGRTLADVLPHLWPTLERAFRHVLEREEPVLDQHVRGETPAEPGRVREWLASYYPVRSRRGDVIGIGGVVTEVTEQRAADRERERLLAAEQEARGQAERARDRLAFLARASAALGESLDLGATLDRLARLLVPAHADMVMLDVLEGGEVRPIGCAHVDAALEPLLRELHVSYPPAAEGRARVIETRRALLVPSLPAAELAAAARDDRHRGLLERLGPRSLMIVPLAARGHALGALSLARARAGAYGDEDLALALELGARAGLAIENARLYAERTETARALQKSLLPPAVPRVPGADVAVRYRPFGAVSEVGGDFYDVFEIGDGEWGLAVGDVTGKGPYAAAVTGLVRHTLRAVAAVRAGAGALLAVNDALLAESAERFCTVAFGRMRRDGAGAELEICLAGHPPPLVLRADGSVARLGVPGSLLGAFPEPQLALRRERLAPGDVAVFYTDGVVEARHGGAFFGEERLVEIVRGSTGLDAAAVADRIERAVLDFAAAAEDDVALLVVRLTG